MLLSAGKRIGFRHIRPDTSGTKHTVVTRMARAQQPTARVKEMLEDAQAAGSRLMNNRLGGRLKECAQQLFHH